MLFLVVFMEELPVKTEGMCEKGKNQLVTRQSRSFLIPQPSLKFTIFLNDFALSGFLFSDSKQPY